MPAHRHRKLVLRDAVLADDAVEGGFWVQGGRYAGAFGGGMPMGGGVFVGTGEAVGACRGGGGVRGAVAGEMGALGGDGRRRAQSDAFGEDHVGVFGGEGAGAGEFVGVAVGVEEVEGHVGPVDLPCFSVLSFS